MSGRMKGLLKGLRHISHLFDAKEEQEMQIGYPTDVKHVAHIGWDGNALNSPSWMGAFRSASLASESAGDPSSLLPLPGLHGLSPAAADSPTRSPGARKILRRRKQQQQLVNGTAAAEESPNREPSSRRRSAKRSDEGTLADSPRQDPEVAASRRKKSVAGKGSSSSSRSAKSRFWAAASEGGDGAAGARVN